MKARRRERAPTNDAIKVRGFFRLNITEDGKVVGDSGWCPNQVVNLGFQDYLAALLGAVAGSKQISRMTLGTGTAPGATDTSLHGEISTAVHTNYTRTTVTAATVASKTARFTATFASSSSHISAAVNLSNIAILNNTTSAGTIMAGNTYASSAWNTNQDVNATYEIRFSALIPLMIPMLYGSFAALLSSGVRLTSGFVF